MENFVLTLACCTTLLMTGIVWFVQVIHYPLFLAVSPERFAAYEQRHTQLAGYLIGPVMLLELAFAIGMLSTSSSIYLPWAIANLILLVIIWLSTFLIQVPYHKRLKWGFEPSTIRQLIRSNWIRTVSWTVRSLIMLWIVFGNLNPY